ncbi:OmpA family protein [Elongatibacter sediminis]|uniref:OmpA family protein n=1 Tax=Elongatibacter sediminis TaxID=3119006 RepID=A0AAW9RNN4_9GAMM
MHNRKLITIIISGALLQACSTVPDRIDVLEDARTAVDRVEQDPMSSRVAGNELEEARDALARAEESRDDGEELEAIRHDAYLALRHAEIVEQRVKEARIREQIAASEQERNAILLRDREREALAARSVAEARAAQAAHADARAAHAEAVAEANARQAERKALEAELAQARAADAMADARALEAELEALKARETERGMVLTLGDVLFDYDRSELKPGAASTLDRVAAFLKDYPERQLLIEGHTDSDGDAGYNRELSERRASAVRDALIQRGVDDQRLDAAGLGEAYPVATNDTVAGRQENRRVEIVISDEEGEFPPAVERRIARQ